MSSAASSRSSRRPRRSPVRPAHGRRTVSGEGVVVTPPTGARSVWAISRCMMLRCTAAAAAQAGPRASGSAPSAAASRLAGRGRLRLELVPGRLPDQREARPAERQRQRRGEAGGCPARARLVQPVVAEEIASMPSATSAAEPAKTPTWSRVRESRVTPVRGTVPKLGFMPQTPQKAAGRTTEPAVWVPSASGTPPAATVAGRARRRAARRARRRMRVAGSGRRRRRRARWSRSCPRTSAPASRRRRTTVASASGRRPASSGVPFSVGMSAVSTSVLDRDGHAGERALRAGRIDRLRPLFGRSAVEMAPRRGSRTRFRRCDPAPPRRRAAALSRPARTLAAVSPAPGQRGSAGASVPLSPPAVVIVSPSARSHPRAACPGRLPRRHPGVAWQGMRAGL